MELNEEVVDIIENNNDSFIQNELIPFLTIPSYTLNRKGIDKARDFIISYISDFSQNIEEIEGDKNNLIIAKVKGQTKSSLLIYMMYDTQPINNYDDWISPPFNADINILPSLEKIGKCIVARGAYNSKTSLLSFLNIVKILKLKNILPISLYLIFDGEEEIGSPTFLKFLKHNINQFKNCIDAYYPSIKQDIDGVAIVKLGYKGIISFTLKTNSKNQEVHSSYSNIIPNPSLDLLKIINGIYLNNNLQIDTLSKNYILSEQEKLLIDKLCSKEHIEKIRYKAGINQLSFDNIRNLLINYLFSPTFNISTLKSGYLKKGIKNSVPNSASCNIDIRFAHRLSSEVIFNEIKNKVYNVTKEINSKVEIIKNNGYESSRVDIKSISVKSILKVFKKLGIESEIWPISAAAAPLSRIQSELGINYISAGLGIGGNAHCANEFVKLKSIIDTRLSYYYFLKYYSEFMLGHN